jgi:competence protein ComEA
MIKRFLAEQETVHHPASAPVQPVHPFQTSIPSTPLPMTPTPTPEKTIFVPFAAPLVNDRAAASFITPIPPVAHQSPTTPVSDDQLSGEAAEQTTAKDREASPPTKSRVVAILLILALVLAIYLIWNPPAPNERAAVITSSSSEKTVAQETPSTSKMEENAQTPQVVENATIQVYVVGAVHKPGVYTLPVDARVHQLLKAAGGPLPEANLVALNMAAKLLDGQEVYVTRVGEKPPSYIGGVPGPADESINQEKLVNINTASIEEMRERLHVSSQTAQSIIDYREVHGRYTAIEQLLEVVSASIYDKIKVLVTV